MVGRFRRISRRLRRFLSQGSIEQRIAPETLREERLRAYSTSKILETSDMDCVLKADLMINGRHRRLAWQETGNTEDCCDALTREWLEEWQVQIRVKKIAQCKGMPHGGTYIAYIKEYPTVETCNLQKVCESCDSLNGNRYILSDGLVCGILECCYESRRISAISYGG